MKNPPPTTTTSTPPPSTRSFNAAEQDDEVERSSADERSNLETIIGMRRERSLTAHLYEAGERKMTSSTYPNRSISNLSSSSYQHRPLLTASADPIRACSGGTRSSSPSSSSSSSKRRHLLAYILLVLTLTVQCCSSQHIVYRRTPWIRSRTSQDIPTFRGDENDNEGFYFVKMTYLENWGQDRDILLIGARNRIFMLDAHPATGSSVIKFKKRMDIPADSTSVEWCQKRITVNKCANYIREMYLMEDDTLLVCGTNSKSPKTHHFKPGDFDQEGAKLLTETCELETGCICGRGRKKSVSIRIRENGTSHFFAAGYDDGFNDRDWFLTESNKNIHTSKKQFNSPDYIKILEYGKKIFLFFLEDEVGYSADVKIRYGRVAQVCKDDSFNNVFSTFVKARLYCNVPQGGSRSIVYDELTAVSDVVQVVLRNGQPAVDVVFATFTSPKEWNLVKQTSAVCMYTMDQINTLFNEGDFLKEGSTATGTMYSYPSPQPDDIERLTTCNYGTQTSSTTITWASNNFMMFNAIKPQFEAAVFVSESNVRINSIKVDTNAGFSSNLMLYLGTEQGLVLRVKPRCTERYPTSVFMEEMNFSDFGRGCKEDPSNCVVKAITLTPRNSTTEPSLVVAFADRIVFSNLATCSLHTNRTICEADPECGYDSSEGHCVQRTPDNREYLGQVRTIEGEVEVVNKTATIGPDLNPGSDHNPGTDDGNPVIPAPIPYSAGISSKVIFFFLGLVIGLFATLVFVVMQKRKKNKKNETYSPSKVSLKAVHRRHPSEGIDNPPEQAPTQQHSHDAVVVTFAEDSLTATSSGDPTLDLRSGGSEQNSLIQRSNQNNQNNLNLIDEIMPAVKSIERDFARDREDKSMIPTTTESESSQSAPLIPEVAPKLPPKRKHLEAKQAASIANSNSNNNSNNNNNNSNNFTSLPRQQVETADTLLLINQSLSKPPPIRPKMGVSRFHSFRTDQTPRVKPKIAPKPVLRSHSFQTRPTFSTSDLHPVSNNSEEQTDSLTRLLDD